MNTYELTYIVSAEMGDSNIAAVQPAIEAVLTENGAKKKDLKNDYTTPQKKKLSFEIKKANFGYYTTIYFDAFPEAIKNISNILRLDGKILRFLITSVQGEIPRGAVISKKEVEQQIENAIEDMVKENQNQNMNRENQDSLNPQEREQIMEEKGNKTEEQESKESEGLDSAISEKHEEKEEESKEKPKSKGGKKKEKTSFDDLDKKLDEILE